MNTKYIKGVNPILDCLLEYTNYKQIKSFLIINNFPFYYYEYEEPNYYGRRTNFLIYIIDKWYRYHLYDSSSDQEFGNFINENSHLCGESIDNFICKLLIPFSQNENINKKLVKKNYNNRITSGYVSKCEKFNVF